MTSPTYVLVHGAWSGPWYWRDLTAQFDERGVAWRAVDLPSAQRDGDPLADLDQDAAVVAAACEGLGNVVLVGHSYGGAVVTQAAHLVGELSRIVYIAAIVPAMGESATDVSRLVRVRTILDEAMILEGPILRLNFDLVASAFYHDCDPAIQDWALPQHSTQTLASFRSPRTGLAVPVASRYIICRDDHAIDPSLQDILAARCSEHVELSSGHSPFFSHPAELADLITA
ncbi:MAG: alpha/beta hydrolase [Acidobacteriota bacterium]|nr:alpha/beta hydrolase [Acidobacteriota bacterium]